MYTRFFFLLFGVGLFGALPRAAALNPDSLLNAALDAAQTWLDKREDPSTRKAIDLLQQTSQHPAFQQAHCALRSMLHHKIGVGYYRLSEYSRALVFLRDSALQTRLHCLGKTHPETGNSLYVVAMTYKFLENLPLAAQYLSQAIETLEAQALNPANQQKLAGYYEENASLYERQGDYRTAGRYLRQAQKLAEQMGVFEGARKAKWLFRAGSLALSDQQYPTALDHYSTALALYQSLDDADYSEPIANCRQNLGKIFLYHGPDLKKAEAYAQQAIAGYRLLPAAGINLSLSYELLGLIAKRRHQWQEALRYFKKALSLREKSGTAELVANAWENMGDVYLATRQPEKALQAYRLGARSTQKTDILRAGRLRAETLLQLAAQHPNAGYREEALLLYTSLDSVATELRLFYRDEGAKQQLLAEAAPFYEKAIQTALELYRRRGEQHYLETAYFFSTQNKALLLQDGLQELRAKDLGLPDSVALRESQLRRDCYRLLVAADPAYSEARLAYQHFIQQVERSYPEYYRIKFAPAQRIDPALVQQKLAADAAILEFFTGATVAHLFLLSPYAGLQVFSAPLPPDVQGKIRQLRALAEDLNDDALLANYAQVANPLFQTLLQQPLAALRAETTRLCLVPDAPLLKLPFDMLPTQPVERWDGAEGPLLIRRFALSTAFSTRFLLDAPQQRRRQKENLQLFGGFGLEYDDQTLKALQAANQDLDSSIMKRNFGRLAYSDDEVREIAGLLHGTAWLNTDARKSIFLKNVDRFRILHLAMHGFLKETDPQRSALIFSKSPGEQDFYLHLAEIYGLRCAADMVVLSACNSSNGPSVPGEGLQSLALAFAYAGCPSVVANQWSASDQASKDILLRFYRYLNAGQPKDIALQRAKLDYMQQSMPTYSTPAYWSSLVLIGDPAAILRPDETSEPPASPQSTTYRWLAALVLLTLALFGWWKRGK